MTKYWLVRKGKGAVIERSKAYKYQGLALGFKQAQASPFIVTVEPKADNSTHINSHEGQEFNLVLKGTLLLTIDGRELTLYKGDSIYFDSSLPHGMIALNNDPAIFLAILI
jgi:quercetin dioxygenase-like cupin family protein